MKRTCLLIAALLALPRLVAAVDSDPARAFREMEWARHQQTIRNQTDPLAKIPVHEPVYDVTFYDLDVTLDPSDSSLVGSVRVHARSLVDTLSRIELDLNDTLVVTGVGENAASFVHEDHLLTIPLDRTYISGETFVVEVDYGGDPRPYRRNGLGWRLHGSTPVVYTMVEPFFSHHWWPCKDVPWDKADSSAVSITVPEPLVGVSNGLRVSVDSISTPGWRTYRWKTGYPIPPYLIFIAASDYILLQDAYDNGVDPTVPITHYVFPEDKVAAETTFAFTSAMLEFLEPVYGAYPFRDERYGHVEIWGTGAMEHNTCTSWGDRLVVGNRGSDDVVVHEMGHQWWGDLVTCADWNHIWLNEGFATYTEALWREHRWGQSALSSYMKILEWHGSQPVYVDPVPDLDTLFSSLIVPAIYYKGSWVLHMLRHEMGDEDFFLSLKQHKEDSADRGGFATTDQFRASCEAVSGLDLERFFRQWVYLSGSPSFEADPYVSASGESLWLRLRQDAGQDTCFAADLDVTVYGAGGSARLLSLPVRSLTDTFLVETEEEIVRIAYDEENWLLDEGFSSSLDSSLAIDEEDGRATLSWSVEDPFATGVFLYRGATDKGPWEKLTSSIVPLPKEGEWDDGIPTERRYYVIRAVSDSLPGYFSLPSNVVETATPSSTELVFGTDDDPASSNPFFLGGEPYKIRFQLAQSEAARVLIQVYDITGRLVRTLHDDAMNPGYSREVEWDGENSEGREVAQGIYLIRFEAGEYTKTRKVVLLK